MNSKDFFKPCLIHAFEIGKESVKISLSRMFLTDVSFDNSMLKKNYKKEF